MKFIDMFSGMGTVRMGFEQAGHECVYSIEWDKHKRQIYGVIFGNEPEGSDIRRVRADELPRADCWAAGFPCQDISVAGKQLGFRGHRSSLFFSVTRLIRDTEEENRPSYLLFENVKNFFSVNGGYDFLTALIELDEIGYDCEWQLLNSKDFGVPQNRERVFIVGHFRGRSTRKIFPICPTSTTTDERNISNCIDANYFKGIDNHGARTAIAIQKTHEATTTIKVEETGTLQSARLDKVPCACLTPDHIDKRQNGRRLKNPGEPSFTLTKQDIHGILLGKQIRKFTPRECMRLQGVSDYITDKLIDSGISDTQMYRAAGDACTVNVICEIASRMEVN